MFGIHCFYSLFPFYCELNPDSDSNLKTILRILNFLRRVMEVIWVVKSYSMVSTTKKNC